MALAVAGAVAPRALSFAAHRATAGTLTAIITIARQLHLVRDGDRWPAAIRSYDRRRTSSATAPAPSSAIVRP